MVKEKFIVTATGDSLFTADIPEEYFNGDFKEVKSYLDSCDLKMTNLETNVEKFGDYPNSYSGGTWLNTEPEVFDDLTKFGFDYYGTANNHCMDYGYHGMFSTIHELDKRGLAHSGTGRDLDEASAPAIVEKGGVKTAILAVCCEYSAVQVGSRAGNGNDTMKGRPGVNYFRHNDYLVVDKEEVDKLRDIAEKSGINAEHDRNVAGGFSLPDPEGVFTFGELKVRYDEGAKATECNKSDKERIIKSIKDAKAKNDHVFILIHCHDSKAESNEIPPDYYEELARACIDAGASAVIGGGTHELRAIEIYKGKPILYSLGDFIYQGMRVAHLPVDFLEKYGCDKNATAWEGLMARSKNNTIGLQVHKCNFMTVLPKITYEGDEMVDIELLPVVAGFKKQGKLDGLPYVAKGEEAIEIFDVLSKISAPYGTKLEMRNGKICIK